MERGDAQNDHTIKRGPVDGLNYGNAERGASFVDPWKVLARCCISARNVDQIEINE